MAFRRGPNQWTKPEHALKRADDLLQLGQKNSALEVLSSVASRRNKNWEKSLEQVVVRFLDLAVETGKGKRAKDVLHQYRNVAQQQQPQSLELVLRHFIKISEQATYASKAKVEEQIAALTEEAEKERIEREILSPWLRFLWETYRTVLEILRTNTRLEGLYKTTAEQAFEYCVKFNRTGEFKRLADLLRTHVSNTLKQTPGYYEAQENVLYQLNLRFAQLNAAVKLQLWQEAFRTVEDMKGTVLVHAKAPIPPLMLAAYYEHLATLFFISKNFFHHALALAKCNAIKKEIAAQNDDQDAALTSEVDKVLASKVLLAALCTRVVDPVDRATDLTLGNSYDVLRDRDSRLAALLDFDGEIRRDVLLEQLVIDEVPKASYEQVRQLHSLLETTFRPLHFGRDFANVLSFIEGHDDLKQYSARLQEVGFQKLLLQLVRVYRTMELTQLQRLLLPREMPILQVEQNLVRAFREGVVPGSIDHTRGVISFEAEQLDADDMRFRLAELARSLRSCVALIEPERAVKALERKRAAWTLAAASVDEERKRVLERRALIERVKELREAKEAKEAKETAERERKEREEHEALEESRRKDKQAKREAKAAAAAKVESDRKKAEALAAKLSEMTTKTAPAVAAKVVLKKEEITKELEQKRSGEAAPVDPEQLVKDMIKKVVEEGQKAEQQVLTANTRMDHMVRARRELEAPLVQKLSEERVSAARRAVETQRTEFLTQHRAAFDNALALKQRLTRMNEARKDYEARQEAAASAIRSEKESERSAKVAEWRSVREPQLRAKLEEEAARKKRQEEDSKRREEEERLREEDRRRQYEEDAERFLEEEEAREQSEGGGDWRAQPASGGPKPWRTPGGGGGASSAPAAAASNDGSGPKPWRTPVGGGGASAAPAPSGGGGGWRNPAGGSAPQRPSAVSASEDRPAPSAASGGGGGDGPKPWRRPGGAGDGGDSRPAPAPSSGGGGGDNAWRRPGGGGGGGAPSEERSAPSSGGDGPKPWRTPGSAASEERPRQTEERSGGGGGDGPKPWRRPGPGGESDSRPAPSASTSSGGGGGERAWRGGGEERRNNTEERREERPAPAAVGAERPWRGGAAGGGGSAGGAPSSASAGDAPKPWRRPGAGGDEGSAPPSGGRQTQGQGQGQEQEGGWRTQGGSSGGGQGGAPSSGAPAKPWRK